MKRYTYFDKNKQFPKRAKKCEILMYRGKSGSIWLERWPVTSKVAGSSPVFFVFSECGAVGSVPVLGIGGRMFKSYHSEYVDS